MISSQRLGSVDEVGQASFEGAQGLGSGVPDGDPIDAS
jgi:hypothetical protein